VVYSFGDLDELVPGYAARSTSRKEASTRRGIPLHTQHYVLLQRNLLYTGITRGRRLVVLVGSRKAAAIAVRNNRVQARLDAPGRTAAGLKRRGDGGSRPRSDRGELARLARDHGSVRPWVEPKASRTLLRRGIVRLPAGGGVAAGGGAAPRRRAPERRLVGDLEVVEERARLVGADPTRRSRPSGIVLARSVKLR